MSGTKMQAMILERPGAALELASVERPEPSSDQVLIQVEACAVCRTDLHVLDGELSNPKLPLILGHEIVGIIRQAGASVKGLHEGDRVGVPWLGRTCHNCKECLSGRENLCQRASFTGYTIDGGYAEFSVANAEYCFPIPEQYSAAEAAPLLCAGLIGWRSYKMAGALAATMSSRPALTAGDTIDRSISRLGIYGFGAAGHII